MGNSNAAYTPKATRPTRLPYNQQRTIGRKRKLADIRRRTQLIQLRSDAYEILYSSVIWTH